MGYRVLLVEDERIVARDLRDSLEGLGYEVIDTVSTGEDAVEKAGEKRPDLVLMDIILKGEMDGVEASGEIRRRYDIPVVYLTAHTDISTVERVKETEPYGYVVKPFRIGELRSVIEIAIHKHNSERKLREESESIASLLGVIGSGVMTIDGGGIVRYMNRKAEDMIGMDRERVIGLVLNDVLKPAGGSVPDAGEMVNFAFEEGEGLGRYDSVVIDTPDGESKSIDIHLMRLEDVEEGISGVALIFTEAGISPHSGEILSLYGIGGGKEEIGLVVAGSSLVREGIRGVLRGVEGVEIVAEISGREELSAVLDEGRGEILFMDALILGENAGEVLDEISGAGHDLKTVLFVHQADEEFIRNCVARGVNGFITDNSDPKDIIRAAHTVLGDGIWMDKSLLEELLQEYSILDDEFNYNAELTEREKEILSLLKNGMSNKQITQRLGISLNTVKNHIRNIYEKLGVHSRYEIIGSRNLQ